MQKIGKPLEVVASLEGMKVIVKPDICTLQEYDYVSNRWIDVDSRPWPLTPEQAEHWLEGWNRVDRFSALNRLIAPIPE